MHKITVPAEEAGRRLDKYLLKYLDAAPRSFLYRAFRKKSIKLRGKRADGSEILQAGDEIELYFSEERLATLMKDGGAAAGRKETPQPSESRQSFSPAHAGRDVYAVKSTSGSHDLRGMCDIVYEDDNLIIADKYAGVMSQKAEASDYSLNEALRDYCRKSKNAGGDAGEAREDRAFAPSVCNRLDRNTTGLICFAKNYGAFRALSDAFRERKVDKYYIAAVKGRVEGNGRLRGWIIKDEASNKVRVFGAETPGAVLIETLYTVPDEADLRQAGFDSAYGSVCGTAYTLLKIELITGKTHQIRAHLASAGHPVLGDVKYGDRALCRSLKSWCGITSQLLHSYELVMPEFLHGPLGYLSGRTFRAELPAAFSKLRNHS